MKSQETLEKEINELKKRIEKKQKEIKHYYHPIHPVNLCLTKENKDYLIRLCESKEINQTEAANLIFDFARQSKE